MITNSERFFHVDYSAILETRAVLLKLAKQLETEAERIESKERADRKLLVASNIRQIVHYL